MPSALWIFISVAFSTVCGVLSLTAVRYAARRNLAQPIDVAAAAEERILAALERDPAQWLRARRELTGDDFSSEDRRRRLTAVAERVDPAIDDDIATRVDTATEARDEAAVAAACDTIRSAVGGVALDSEAVNAFLRDGGEVLSCSASRAQHTDRSPIVETGFDHRPYTRGTTHVSTRRRFHATVLGAGVGIIGCFVGNMIGDGGTAVLAALTIAVIGLGGIVVSYVDYDTFYLDTRTFVAWAVAAWAAAAGAAAAGGRLTSLIAGVAGAAGVAVGFEVIARGWGKLRGITQGAGDTWIALVTAGVPAALCADWRVAVWSVLAGSCSVVGHWLVLWRRRQATSGTPVPFGPHLVAGAFAAMLFWAVLG